MATKPRTNPAWQRPGPDEPGVPTTELDLAAIADLVHARLEAEGRSEGNAEAGDVPKPKRRSNPPPKAAPRRPTPRGGRHEAPGVGWSTAAIAIVALIVIAVVVLGLALIHAYPGGL